MNTDNHQRNASPHTLGLLMLLALFTPVVGCSSHSTSPMAAAAPVVRLTPANGATAVRLDAPTVVDFGLAVDRATVQSGLHLLSEADMTTGLCPDPSMGSHGTMESMMSDPAMLEHLDHFHSTPGTFSWNAAGTVCTFHPDSLMKPQMRYMVHMTGDMMQMVQRMGGTMMGGPMNSAGDVMVHFETMAADGHAGHH